MMLADEMVGMHAGGWDEMLVILGPLLIIVALIAIARRARPPEDEEADSPDL